MNYQVGLIFLPVAFFLHGMEEQLHVLQEEIKKGIEIQHNVSKDPDETVIKAIEKLWDLKRTTDAYQRCQNSVQSDRKQDRPMNARNAPKSSHFAQFTEKEWVDLFKSPSDHRG